MLILICARIEFDLICNGNHNRTPWHQHQLKYTRIISFLQNRREKKTVNMAIVHVRPSVAPDTIRLKQVRE